MTYDHFLKALLILCLALAALCIGIGLRIQGQANRHRRNAEVFLAALRQLRVGESTDGEVKRLVRGQEQFLTLDSPSCQDEFCTYSFIIGGTSSNLDAYVLRWLQLWRFNLAAAPGLFGADLELRRDHLVRVSLLLISQVSVNVQDEVPDISPVSASYLVDNSRPSQTVIYVKPSATVEQRESAYSFNLNCLDKLGGCTDKSQLIRKLP